MRSLIEFSPELSELNKQAKRIADALEALLLHAYGVSLRKAEKEDIIEEGDVQYATDEQQLAIELQDMVQPSRKRRELEEEL